MSHKWTEQELEILKQLYGKTPIEDICQVLKSRTKRAIERKACDLKLSSFTPEIDINLYKQLTEVTEG